MGSSARLSLPSAAALEREFALFGADGLEHEEVVVSGGAISCTCARCDRWRRYCRGEGEGATRASYQVITRELVDGVATWLRARASRRPDTDFELVVLEVGAGDGHLGRAISEALAGGDDAPAAAVKYICTDIEPRGAGVARAAYADALQSYDPDIVICCWMPLGDDWTAAFREHMSVRAYVLIGEVDDGCCGEPWATWGYVAERGRDSCSVSSTSSESDRSDADGHATHERPAPADDARKRQRALATGDAWRRAYEHSPQTTPWGAEEWCRVELACVTPSALVCRTDEPWLAERHSRCVLFSRDPPTPLESYWMTADERRRALAYRYTVYRFDPVRR